MPAFNSRIEPKEIAGRPACLFYYGLPALVLVALSVFPFFLIRVVCLPVGLIFAGLAIYNTMHHEDALLMKAKRFSKHEGDSFIITSERF